MIALVLLATGLTQAPTTPSWCDSLYTLALVTAQAHAAGMPRQQVEAAARQLPSMEARAAAAGITSLVYEVASAGRLPPERLAGMVRATCLQQNLQAGSR